MNREIKFRVWDSVKNEMISSDLICKLGLFGLAFLSSSDTKAMQYTGINDKDGIEIYGGDIVMRTSTLPGSFDFVGVVEMLEGCWVIHYENGAEKLWTECDINEVIGNIHENPELLEAK